MSQTEEQQPLIPTPPPDQHETNEKETPSTRWTDEPNSSIRHPRSIMGRKPPKVLIWKDLNVSVPIQHGSFFRRTKEMRAVLNGVSGVAEPGQILAIMGESGAGKTTLLNVLTHRNLKNLNVEGEVNVNGDILTPAEMQRMSAYVQQHDLFMGSMSVREHLIFSARLRMGREYTNDERMQKVEEVILKMGLANCQHVTIGQKFTKSISLGEKKRLAFASEILMDPPIMFCDEPTSGLDAYMAKQVILCLKKLAEEGHTVVITIHQPSSQIFQLFDRICFMGMGRVIYLGPVKKVESFFKSVGYPMAAYTNPSEHAIRQLAIQEGEHQSECLARKIADAYEKSAMAKDYLERVFGPISERRRERYANRDIREGHRYASHWTMQFWCLYKRSFLATLRDPLMMKIRLLQTLITATIVGIIFFKMDLQRETIMTFQGVLFNTLRDSYFIYVFPNILVFTEELPVFLRENHARIYSTDAYFVAKNVAELPQFLFLAVMYTTIVYFMTGVMSLNFLKWVNFTCISMSLTAMALSMAYVAACVFGTVEVAVQVMPLLTLPLLTLAGFFINLDSVPIYFKPLGYVSWFKYAFEAYMITLWDDQGQIEGCSNVSVSVAEELTCKGGNGMELLKHYAFHTSQEWVWINLGAICGLVLIVRGIALFALWLRSHFTDS